MARILVTGASGYIGSWLVAHLSGEGHELDLLLRDEGKINRIRQQCRERGGNPDKLHALKGDLSLPDLGLKARQGESRTWDVIIHSGALFGWGLDYQQAYASNVQGSLAMVKLAARHEARLIWLGGFMLLNPVHLAELKLDECVAQDDYASIYRKVGVYEASKIEAHFRSRLLAERLKVNFNVIHPATVCGHSVTGEVDSHQALFELCTNLIQGKLSAIPGNASHQLPLVSIDSVCKVVAEVVRQPLPSGTDLLVAHPDSLSLADNIRVLGAAMQVPAPTRFAPLFLLKLLLRIPGLEKLFRTSRESLAFIRAEKPDYREFQAFVASRNIALPELKSNLAQMARYIADQQPANLVPLAPSP
ncbi:MAG: SDR family oxidoreductase [Hahellaceae bacterium]|nr:SDR family oxidoreductase [Hahellaceae bacterium]MCP5168234.1 SDR family oxidoreductase [Hahellaceae bacterium]